MRKWRDSESRVVSYLPISIVEQKTIHAGDRPWIADAKILSLFQVSAFQLERGEGIQDRKELLKAKVKCTSKVRHRPQERQICLRLSTLCVKSSLL